MSSIERGIPSEIDLSIDPTVIEQANRLLRAEPDIDRSRAWIHSPEKQKNEKRLARVILTCLYPLLSISKRVVLAVDGEPAFYEYTVAFPGPNRTLINPTKIAKIRTLKRSVTSEKGNPFDQTVFQGGRRRKHKEADPRVHSQLGMILRKTGLDETPQLKSVIRGQIALVGPRGYTSLENEGLHILLENLGQKEGLKKYLGDYLNIIADVAPLPGIAGLYAAIRKKNLTVIERLVLDQLYCLCATPEGDNRILLTSLITTLKMTGAR